MENSTLFELNRKFCGRITIIVVFLLFALTTSFNYVSDNPTPKRVTNYDAPENGFISAPYIFEIDGCSSLETIELRSSDFGFPDGVTDGSLNATNVDLSSKWGLPPGSILVSVAGASTKSSLQLFEVNKDLPATFTFSGTVPVMVVAEHSARVDANHRDGIIALDNVEYIQTTTAPTGIISDNELNDYFVENTTAAAIYGPDRFVWVSQKVATEIKFYTTSSFPVNGIRIRLTPTICTNVPPPPPDTDGDGVLDTTDLDDDNDGLLDSTEDPNLDGDNDPMTDPMDSDGDGIPNHLDIDSDNDGIPDNVEAQTTDGYIAPNEDDEATYTSNDGLNSAYPDGLIPVNTDGEDSEDYIDQDSDNDFVPDNIEGNDFDFDGVADQTPTGTDTDGDGLDDGYEGIDVDDGFDVNDEIDDPANDLPDSDGTEDVDYRDFDDIDTDGDGVLDTTDLDDDNDGLLDSTEDPNLDGDNDPLDSDGDGIPNHLDIDSDNDGIPDNVEAQTTDGYIAPNEDDEATYTSNDGLNSAYPDGLIPVNTDGEDSEDYIDQDSDNDFVPDNIEGNDFDFDGVADQTPTGTDTDGDGLDDGYEGIDVDDGFDVNDEIDDPANDLPDSDGTEDVDYRDFDDIDTDGDGVLDTTDLDDDNDGLLDSTEDPNLDGDNDPLDSDGDGIPNHLDIDSDNDGIPDNVEAQTTDGYIAPNEDDEATYTSNDGLNSAYPDGLIPVNTDGEDSEDYIDQDSDNDFVPDNIEGNDFDFDGVADQTPTGTDTDGDGLDDGYEGIDVDDGFDVNDEIDDPANDLPDSDGTEDVDYRDFDDIDTDGDGVLDTTDLDDDNDGLLDSTEDPNLDGDNDPLDSDGDGIPNHLDIDSDNDGIPDNVEAQTTDGYIAPNEDDEATYTSNDGLNSAYPDGLIPVNTDGEDSEDYIDQDSDNDFVPDNIEGNDFDFDGVADQTPTGTDTDGDGLDDGYEGIDVDDGFDVNDEIDDPANDLPDSDGTEDVDYRDFDDIDTDGDGVLDTTDLDDDNDGLLDSTEDPNLDGDNDPMTDPMDSDGDGIPNHLDIDSDNDGIPDNVEAQTTDGYIAPNEDDEATYTSNDGLNSAYPDGLIPVNTDGEDSEDYIDQDSDNDFVPDNIEGNDFDFDGVADQTPTGTDTDGDGLDDGYEGIDVDDGFDVNDEIDDPANDLPDSDGTEDVDYRDFDDIDTDGDGVLDTTDLDDDNDGLLDSTEDPNLDGDNDPMTDPMDSDGDGIPNHLDIDSDNDGIPDNVEAQTTDGYIAPNEDDEATYTSNDGLNSAYPDGLTPVNTDGEDVEDYLDQDSDNDFVPDNIEGNDFDFDGVADQTPTGTDTDGDGLDDGYEGIDVDDGYDVNDEIDDPANDLPDTDGTGDVNYRDIDDDGDGIDTPDEDGNGDGNPTNDDADGDGIPSYLDPVEPTEIVVMQMVTPNGDGKNEFLWIENVDKALNNSIRIYNRWGVAVYEGEGYNNQNNVFDGRSKGRSTVSAGEYLPAGVYFYIFDYNTANENRITDSGYIYISK